MQSTGVFANLMSPKTIERANWNSSKTEKKKAEQENGVLPSIKETTRNDRS
jgi:hypothetical protein